MYVNEFKETAVGHALMDGVIPPEAADLGLEAAAEPMRRVLERV